MLIVDDHQLFRSRARVILEIAGYEVVGEAGDAASAMTEVARLHPDLVLLDVQLPDGDGFGVAGTIANGNEPPTVVLISSREASDYGTRLEQAPIHGFIHKPDLSPAALQALIGQP